MNKQRMLDDLENAKKIHLQQMQKIADVLEGKQVEHPTALGKMECECGVWFYSNQERMINILGAQLFHRLDDAHEAWHRDYVNIYNIFFKEKKTGLFSKLLGTNKVDAMTLDKAKLYYSELKKDTDELFHAADAAIRRVSALSSSKFH